MSSTITIQEAQARLKDLIDKLAPGEEVVITDNQRPVAKLVGQRVPARNSRQPGGCKGMITLLSEDDEHLKNFAEYMD